MKKFFTAVILIIAFSAVLVFGMYIQVNYFPTERDLELEALLSETTDCNH